MTINAKPLTQSLLSTPQTGFYFAKDSLTLPDNTKIPDHSYLFLKKSLLHNPHGPALVTTAEKEAYLWFYLNGHPGLSKPFSCLGYSYPSHPSNLALFSPPSWNGSQFTFNYDHVFWYAFYNNKGFRHNEFGPAVVSQNNPPQYLLNGDHYSKEEFEEIRHRKNKKEVLKIIKQS